jgi:hypothetical protein
LPDWKDSALEDQQTSIDVSPEKNNCLTFGQNSYSKNLTTQTLRPMTFPREEWALGWGSNPYTCRICKGGNGSSKGAVAFFFLVNRGRFFSPQKTLMKGGIVCGS